MVLPERFITSGHFESFRELISGNGSVYVDKTAFACRLVRMYKSVLLTRPRRMGKSTFLSTLEYLFFHGTKGTKGLACHDLWDDPFRYYVFHLDWSDFDCSSFSSFIRDYRLQLKEVADFFGITLPEEPNFTYNFRHLIAESKKKLADKDFLKVHPELTDNDLPLSSSKVVLLIDEYDAPLTHALNNPELFEQLRAAYRSFFASVKRMDFRFVFLTGVSSYAQTSIFSGANQFTNISLNPKYATCCGYTEAEIKRYFSPELERAQEVLGVTQEQLLAQMHYHYDGYLFSESFNTSDKVFNPVSVSRFLVDPQLNFKSYWAETGGNESFLTTLFKNTEPNKALDVLNMLEPKFNELPAAKQEQLVDFIDSLAPAVCLATSDKGENNSFGSIIEIPTDNLTVKFDNVKDITTSNAAQILFQAGYLSIKGFNGSKAKLGFANHEVKDYLIRSLFDKSNQNSLGDNDVTKLLYELFDNGKQVLQDFRNGGQQVAKQINNMLNIAPINFFSESQHELAYTFIVNICLNFACIKAKQEIMYCEGRSDLAIFRDEQGPLVEDVIIEFKVARKGNNVFTKIKEGSQQTIRGKYGISVFNPKPIRHCVVISPGVPGVAAVSRIEEDQEPVIEYLAENVNPKTGKVIYKNKSKPKSSRSKRSRASTAKASKASASTEVEVQTEVQAKTKATAKPKRTRAKSVSSKDNLPS